MQVPTLKLNLNWYNQPYLQAGPYASPFLFSTILISFNPHMFAPMAKNLNPSTMRANWLNLITLSLSFVFLFSCKKNEEFITEPLTDYIPLEVGREIIYRLDSLDFSRSENFVHYQEKHVVDAEVTDAMGRPSFRIYRFLRDTLGVKPWVSAGTYYITPAKNRMEVIENNLRFVKLITPIQLDNTWKGNQFLPDEPFDPLFKFINDSDMEFWDYTYTSTGETLVLNGETVPDVITVSSIDRVDNVPVTDPSGIGYIDLVQEKYAKGIGLVYQRFAMWEYQPPNISNPAGKKTGFDITRTMIDHN